MPQSLMNSFTYKSLLLKERFAGSFSRTSRYMIQNDNKNESSSDVKR